MATLTEVVLEQGLGLASLAPALGLALFISLQRVIYIRGSAAHH